MKKVKNVTGLKKKAASTTEAVPVKKVKKAKAVEAAPVKKVKKLKTAEAAPVKGKKVKKLKTAEAAPVKGKKVKASKSDKPARKARVKKEVAPVTPVKSKLNKTQLVEHLIDQTGLEKKVVKDVLEALEQTILGSVVKKGNGEFMLPGLLKVKTKKIPARKGGEKKMSFGREIITKPRPATIKVKVLAMKKLKDAALA